MIGHLGGESESAVTAPYAICRNFIDAPGKLEMVGTGNVIMFFFIFSVNGKMCT